MLYLTNEVVDAVQHVVPDGVADHARSAPGQLKDLPVRGGDPTSEREHLNLLLLLSSIAATLIITAVPAAAGSSSFLLLELLLLAPLINGGRFLKVLPQCFFFNLAHRTLDITTIIEANSSAKIRSHFTSLCQWLSPVCYRLCSTTGLRVLRVSKYYTRQFIEI